MQLKIKKLNPEARLPKFGYSDDAGMDLFSVENMTILPGEKAIVKTGIAIEIPNGCGGFIQKEEWGGWGRRGSFKEVKNMVLSDKKLKSYSYKVESRKKNLSAGFLRDGSMR